MSRQRIVIILSIGLGILFLQVYDIFSRGIIKVLVALFGDFAPIVNSILPYVLLIEILGRVMTLASVTPTPNLKPINMEENPLIDQASLKIYTDILEYHGFGHIGDFCLMETPDLVVRIFIHFEEHLYVEVFEKINSVDIPMKCSLSSNFRDDWILITSDRPMLYGNYLFRSPKKLYVYEPVTPDRLLATHLTFRQQMMQDLGIELQTELSLENYIAITVKLRRQQLLQILFKSLILTQIEQLIFNFRPTKSWLGKYKPSHRNA